VPRCALLSKLGGDELLEIRMMLSVHRLHHIVCTHKVGTVVTVKVLKPLLKSRRKRYNYAQSHEFKKQATFLPTCYLLCGNNVQT